MRSKAESKEVSEKNGRVRETQRRTLNIQVMAKTLSLFPEPQRPRYTSFLQVNPCLCHLTQAGFLALAINNSDYLSLSSREELPYLSHI